MSQEVPEPPEAAPPWPKQSLPYIVVVRDNSTYQIPLIKGGGRGGGGKGEDDDDEEEGGLKSRASSTEDGENEPAGEFVSKMVYPQVKYVFADDDFNPTVDVLENEKEKDISLVIDFDENGNVVNYQSLSPQWQITNVATSTSNAPSWMPDDQSSTKLFIDGTNKTTTTLRKKKPQGSLQDTKDLIQAVKDRSEQLRQLLYDQQD